MTNTQETMTNKRQPTKPTYHAYSVTEAKNGKKGLWTRLGSFFAHEDGQGGTLLLSTLPINFDGRIVLRIPFED